MGIKKIRLSDFRNFKKKELEFSDGITVIVGPNASGKTNILEGLFLLSTGKSFRARIEEETINHNSSITRLRSTNLEVVLTRDVEGWPRKRLLVNGIPKRLIDFAGNFKVTLFGPWDMGLVTEPPSVRRGFLDMVLSQVDREYRRALLSYEKGLKQRNRVLWQIRENLSTPFGRPGRERLLFWDKLLIKNGNYISTKRKELIDFINATGSLNDQEFNLTYNGSAISQGRLEQYTNEEIASATTLVGPHRDDFQFSKKRDLSRFGSRGEQRMAILWLKLAELKFIEAKTGERPTLLLDDIFSELDNEHRKVVVKVLKGQQTIITTADEHFVKGLKKAEKIMLL